MMDASPHPHDSEDSNGNGASQNRTKRGRPRVEKNDASAADRRRTQIRLAQRAYRQRKENALDDLQGRVAELTNTIEQMQQAFFELDRKLCTAGGLCSGQLLDLKDTGFKISSLAERARMTPEEGPTGLGESASPAGSVNGGRINGGGGNGLGEGAAILAGAVKRELASPSLQQRQYQHQQQDSRLDDNPTRAGVIGRPNVPVNVPSWIDKTVAAMQPSEDIPTNQIGMGYSLFPSDHTNGGGVHDTQQRQQHHHLGAHPGLHHPGRHQHLTPTYAGYPTSHSQHLQLG
ncbi:hypothetical protein K431DRAFT_104983 [Polychaeton citri CBS 116435]|uniref:BZIP domain-containing protein n=1 Tax=Polychaeton citri CBS 116435 TaxID=1314669 RepID=A0A9P4Q7X3_9PEZI|nr:hypothetical protein K431DRAFT_104983 [Polychaeton citri CBS 116435]